MYIQTLFVSCINCPEYGLGQKLWPGFELKQLWCRQAMKCLLATLHKDKDIEDKLTLVVFVLLHTSHLLMQVFYWYVNGTIKYGTVQDDWCEYPSYCVKFTLLAICLVISHISLLPLGLVALVLYVTLVIDPQLMDWTATKFLLFKQKTCQTFHCYLYWPLLSILAYSIIYIV